MRGVLALLLLLAAPGRAEPLAIRATPAAETEGALGDVDDPAIWVDPADPQQSLILGTDKQGGLRVYGLDGAQRARFADGSLNNVDLRPFRLGGREVGLAGATRRLDETLAFYVIEDGAVRRARPARLPAAPPGLGARGAYGFAMGQDPGGTYAVVTFRTGHVVQWRVTEARGRLRLDLARAWRVGSLAEGLAADDRAGHLYLGEEDRGIWRYPLSPDAPAEATAVDLIPSDCLPEGDVEGLAIQDGAEGRFLLASAQGIDRLAAYRLDGEAAPACAALIEVADGPAADGAVETDGIDATALSLPGYPRGLLVVMDDRNGGWTTNFKLVPWGPIGDALDR
jgi:3-phytase